MKKRWIIAAVVTFLTLYIGVLIYNVQMDKTENRLLLQDVGRLIPVEVREVIQSKEEEQLVSLIKEAKDRNLKVSISGVKHTQGGHTLYPDSIHLDMTAFNQVLSIDAEKKTAVVQSGATWKQVQEAANPYGLSVKVMQSSNIFTVGGSLSVNAHGRDVRYGPMIETINSFRLLTADGEIINVSRSEKPELFYAVVGGYGLFGIILDVEIQLTDDELYEVTHDHMDYTDYPGYFIEKVLGNKDTHLHIARLSTAPGTFLTEMYASNYTRVNESAERRLQDYSEELKEEENIRLNKFVFGLARHWDWGKERLWDLQKMLYAADKVDYMSRNNAMRPEVHFLEYYSKNDTDLLQEYFVPLDQYVPFVDEMRRILLEDQMNVFNITVRYVPRDEEALLSYAYEDMLAVVILINQGLSEEAQERGEKTTQKLVDSVIKHRGTYYLPYQLYPTDGQLGTMYPNFDSFIELKRKYDPEERFMNMFYERYAPHE